MATELTKATALAYQIQAEGMLVAHASPWLRSRTLFQMRQARGTFGRYALHR
jgi:hypothetical protein